VPGLRVLGAALLACALVAAAVAGGARADGDPASDMLVVQNVFLPYEAPSHAAAAELAQDVAAVYAAGERVKVALVATRIDLGAIPSLFGKPSQYAAFLGRELAGFYVGPLLIVMPSGYGIYDGGRSTAAEQGVLARLAPPGSAQPDTLANAAANAVGQLLHAGALRSKDILKPYVQALLARAAGGRLTVQYYLADDSGKAAATLTVEQAGHAVLTADVPEHATSMLRPETQRLTLPHGLQLAGVRVCVAATDPSGNRAVSCRKVGG
jgi:hypothetical protein